jgi:hypothetical protein
MTRNSSFDFDAMILHWPPAISAPGRREYRSGRACDQHPVTLTATSADADPRSPQIESPWRQTPASTMTPTATDTSAGTYH